MTNKKTAYGLLIVIGSNIIKLISGLAFAFLIPKVLSVNNYGYYRLFALYLSYAGFLNFGFIDGIYLKYAGKSFDDLNQNDFKSYFKYLLIFITLITFIIFAIIPFLNDSNLKIIFLFFAINLLSVHLLGYFQKISQITGRFKEFSIRTIILSISNLSVVFLLFILKIDSYIIFLTILVSINYCILMWYLLTYKNITIGKSKINPSRIKSLTLLGLPLLLSNIIIIVIMNTDKQIISLLFDIEDFALYSFAYSSLVIINLIVSAFSIVLYPTLKRVSLEKVKKDYHLYNSIILSLVFLGLSVYFPLAYFLPVFLPNYIGSINIFRFALISLVFTSSITVIKHTYFKLINKNLFFLYIAIIVLPIFITLNLSSYHLYSSMIAISISSLIGFAIWYIITEFYLVKSVDAKWKKNATFILFNLIVYLVLSQSTNLFLSFAIYVFAVSILISVFYGKEFYRFFKMFFSN